jgi:aspartyl-tRNA(Asn)/glutamyl-tRNA(Gln) amidotransferase subunit C
MKLNVKHVAKLANLKLTEDEIIKFEKQLEETTEYVEELNEVNVDGIEPTSQVTGLENISREDEIKPSLSQEEALSNAKPTLPTGRSTYNGFFKVKGILNNE